MGKVNRPGIEGWKQRPRGEEIAAACTLLVFHSKLAVVIILGKNKHATIANAKVIQTCIAIYIFTFKVSNKSLHCSPQIVFCIKGDPGEFAVPPAPLVAHRSGEGP